MSTTSSDARGATTQRPADAPPRTGMAAAFHQPRSVWAIAFAATVSFMGIGLVDPILPAISHELGASPTQAMLLFTSYLFITAIAMFFTSWIASRLGTRTTLLIGLALIIVFAALAAAGTSVTEIIGLRGGWGLGNALFISTALSAIVGATAGPSAGAIMLYETALGIGMAIGPLLGGLLGSWTWRAPFGGTAILMGLGFIAIVTMLGKPAEKPARIAPTAAFRGLADPALRTLSLAAVFYNFAFFAMLAYSPFPLEAAAAASGHELGALGIGGVFFGWGIGLAVTSVIGAPLLTRAFGLMPTLIGALAALTIVMVALAVAHTSLPGMVTLIVIGGLLQGVMNTALTETVMEATELPRSVASSAYSGVRFFGGAVSSAVAGPIAATFGAEIPYVVAAAALVVSAVVLTTGRHHLVRATRPHLTSVEEATAITAADEV
ncbi:MFS transporter [Brachybacterium sp. AOP25-B2-12]|uniref:MFS transporter n=1 Tax=Brachybacterium sp. AOP25-B2-12 TaxID=3457710 RepID=UPI004033DE51